MNYLYTKSEFEYALYEIHVFTNLTRSLVETTLQTTAV